MATRAMSDVATSEKIRFVIDGETIELDQVDPTRTVLQFLREDLRRTGSKEGCAEGDCGACTVVLVELNTAGDDVIVSAINSCIQFLPTLDGKELITVESLTASDEALHPVQQAMVDCHGSQCGFCTPGFVMSLFALYKTNSTPTRRDIDDALAGNLCRCTGYRPIIAAAKAMYGHDYDQSDRDEENWLRQPCGVGRSPAGRIETLQKIDRDKLFAFESDGRRFFAPTSCDELAGVLAANPDATLLAGGTDVGLWVTKQYRELDTVVYTGRVCELRKVSVSDTHIEIGAAVSFTDAMPLIVDHYPQIEEIFLRFASPPIRNAATLGGNIANGSPIGDSMPFLIAADTSLLLSSANGRREIRLQDFYHDYMVNDLRAGEFLECVRIPLPRDTVEYSSYKISKRFDQDISAVCAGFALQRDRKTDRIESVRIAFGGLAATVRRASKAEAALKNQVWDETAVELGMHALGEDFAPISDMRSSSDYRLRVARNLLHRFYLETSGQTEATVYGYGRSG